MGRGLNNISLSSPAKVLYRSKTSEREAKIRAFAKQGDKQNEAKQKGKIRFQKGHKKKWQKK